MCQHPTHASEVDSGCALRHYLFMAAQGRGRVVAEAIGAIGLLWSFVRWLWELLGNWQQAEQAIADWPRFVQWVGSPLAGPAVVAVALAAYLALQFWPWTQPQVVPYQAPPEAPQEDPLVGKFFHTFHRGGQYDGELQYQGRILRQSGGRYFIQLFDTDGDPSDQRFMTDDEVQRAVFYDTHEEWIDAYERWARRSANRDRRR